MDKEIIAPIVSPNPLPQGAESTTQKITTVQENTTSAKSTGSTEVAQTVNQKGNLVAEITLSVLAVAITLAFIYTTIMKIENGVLAIIVGGILGFYTRGYINIGGTKTVATSPPAGP